MSFYHISTIDFVGTNTTIVGSLRSREPVLGPSKGMLVLIQKGVLLFNSKPWVFVFGSEMKLKNANPLKFESVPCYY